jgi:hypothetical protein
MADKLFIRNCHQKERIHRQDAKSAKSAKKSKHHCSRFELEIASRGRRAPAGSKPANSDGPARITLVREAVAGLSEFHPRSWLMTGTLGGLGVLAVSRFLHDRRG